jgi:signal transduction histidine kinase
MGGNNLWIEIQDEGQGFDLQDKMHAKDSLGLLSMMERARQIGGQLSIETLER